MTTAAPPRGGIWKQSRTFDPAVRLLFLNQLTINLGFYMLMPFLAAHLADGLGMAAWAVGLVLGARNLSQQGMFLVGGALADRLGFKPLIVAGCALRTVGFGALAFAQSLPMLIAASLATGLAGALFNPAVRACLAAEAGEERRVQAFALFNAYYQAGILLGPLVGVALTGVSFRPDVHGGGGPVRRPDARTAPASARGGRGFRAGRPPGRTGWGQFDGRHGAARPEQARGGAAGEAPDDAGGPAGGVMRGRSPGVVAGCR
ncbi:Multidrug resistance protein MdtH [Streptomyces narbonensis]